MSKASIISGVGRRLKFRRRQCSIRHFSTRALSVASSRHNACDFFTWREGVTVPDMFILTLIKFVAARRRRSRFNQACLDTILTTLQPLVEKTFMAAPIKSPMTGEIWHLTIDDLFAPLPEAVRLGGPGPFVINLSTSTAPIAVPVKGFADCGHTHVYQMQRTEDRRTRYRLRLGPFDNEDEADAVLNKGRDVYPGA